MSHTRVLIVHPDPSARALLTSMLQAMGHRLDEAASDRAAVRMLEQQPADLVLVGADPADPEALELLSYVRRKHPGVSVVLLFASLPPDRVREALQRGAASVLKFPLAANHLRAAVAQALGQVDAPRPIADPRPVIVPEPLAARAGSCAGPEVPGAPAGGDRTWSPDPILLVGDDPNFRQAIELATSLAVTRAPMLVVGERGTGKTALARALHQRGPRRHGPFLALDCAAHRNGQLETEFFGRAGSTGPAHLDGKLLQTQGGTLLVRNVAALPPDLQYKLLRVLQTGGLDPEDDRAPTRLDVRFVFATCEDLAPLIERDQFRQDLYYRISVATLHLPPLRHRGDDLIRLAEYFRYRTARESRREVIGFTSEAFEALRRHSWPGNVQELACLVEWAVRLCRGPRIEPGHLELHPRGPVPGRIVTPPRRPGSAPESILPLKEALEGPERQIILQALEALNWNRQETARVLDINRTTLYKKMKKYGLLFDEPIWAN